MIFRILALLLLTALTVMGQSYVVEVPTIHDMTNKNPASVVSAPGGAVLVRGYHTNDNGGGLFTYNKFSTAPLDFGIFHTTTTTGRWERINKFDMTAYSFGAIGNGVADDTEALQKAFNYSTNNITVHLTAGRYRTTTNIIVYSNTRIEADPDSWIVGDFPSRKPIAVVNNYGADLPSWGEPMVISATNIYIKGLGITKVPIHVLGYTNIGPFLYLDSVQHVQLRDTRLHGDGHHDWALTLNGYDISSIGHDIDVRIAETNFTGSPYQDGIHIFRGARIQVSGGKVYSGDDVFGIGSYLGTDLSQVVISDIEGVSTYGDLLSFENSTNTTFWAGAPLTNIVENITVKNVVGLAGLERNPMIRFIETSALAPAYGGTNPPLRTLRNITLDGVHVRGRYDTNDMSNAWGLMIQGGENIKLENCSILGGRRSTVYGIWAKDVTFENVVFGAPSVHSSSYTTIRFADPITGAVTTNAPYGQTNIIFEKCYIHYPPTNATSTVLVTDLDGFTIRNSTIMSYNGNSLNFNTNINHITSEDNTFLRFGSPGTTAAHAYANSVNNVRAVNNNYISLLGSTMLGHATTSNLFNTNGVPHNVYIEDAGLIARTGVLPVTMMGNDANPLQTWERTGSGTRLQVLFPSLRSSLRASDGRINFIGSPSPGLDQQFVLLGQNYENANLPHGLIGHQFFTNGTRRVFIGGGTANAISPFEVLIAAENDTNTLGVSQVVIREPTNAWDSPISIMVTNTDLSTAIKIVKVDTNSKALYIGNKSPLPTADNMVFTNLATSPTHQLFSIGGPNYRIDHIPNSIGTNDIDSTFRNWILSLSGGGGGTTNGLGLNGIYRTDWNLQDSDTHQYDLLSVTNARIRMKDRNWGHLSSSGTGSNLYINNGAITNGLIADGTITTGKVDSVFYGLLIAGGGGGGGTALSVDGGSALATANLDDGGDLNFLNTSGTITATVNADAVALGTDTTGNYVQDAAGTANHVTVSGSGSESASLTIDLANVLDIGGITSFEIPNSAAPSTGAFGQIAGDNNAWATGHGAVQFYDGTLNTYLVGIDAADPPTDGQIPVWNNATGKWLAETPSSGGTGFLPLAAGSAFPITGDLFYEQSADIRSPMWERGTEWNAMGIWVNAGVWGVTEFNPNDTSTLETFITIDPTDTTGPTDIITIRNAGGNNTFVVEPPTTFNDDVTFAGDVSVLSDTAFAAAYNGITTAAATKNAFYDWAHTFDTDDDGLPNVLDSGATGVTPSAGDNSTKVPTTSFVQTELTAYATSTATFTGKTFDAAATGNVLKQTKDATFQRPDYSDGAGAVPQTNNYAASGLMHFTFSGSAETNANFVVYEWVVPSDLDSAVAMTATFGFVIGSGTDADDVVLHITYGESVAGSPHPPTIATSNAIMTITPTSPAAGDLQVSSATTLTGWASGLTPGRVVSIKVARLNTTNDDPIRDQYLKLTYGSTQ